MLQEYLRRVEARKKQVTPPVDMGFGSEIKEQIGANITEARKAGGWSLRGFAKLLGISAQFLWQVEAGKKQVPDKMMQKQTKIMRVKPTALMQPIHQPKVEVPQGSSIDARSIELLTLFKQLKEPINDEVLAYVRARQLQETVCDVMEVERDFSSQPKERKRKVTA